MDRTGPARSCAWLAGLALGTALLALPPPARAQCGAIRTTCHACHEEQGRRPVLADGSAWHDDHALGDFCAQCHGGDGEAADQGAAHAGLIDPLADAGRSCATCHTDAAGTIGRYRRLRDAARREPARVVPSREQAADPQWANVALGAVVLAIALVGGGLVWRTERARRRPAAIRRVSLWRRAEWSPYLGGVVLGAIATVSLALGHRLSGASAYQHLSGLLGRLLAPDSIYWRHVVPTGITWDVWALIGGVLGAFVASLTSKTFRWRTMPDREWTEIFGPSVTRRWVIAFFGSALTAVGGGIAGGCTASLAISGGAVLVPGAFLFVAAMFATGTPLALWLHAPPRRKR